MAYEEVWCRRIRPGLVARISYDPAEVLPWVVSYGGNGTYWVTLEAALAYSYGRRFIRSRAEVDAIGRDILYSVVEVRGAENGKHYA